MQKGLLVGDDKVLVSWITWFDLRSAKVMLFS
jgi:hypothetical protein